MCDADMTKLAPEDRHALVLGAAYDQGIAQDWAVAFSALSEGEVSTAWFTHRPVPEIAQSTGEVECCATIVGIERLLMHDALVQDPDAVAWLNARGWLTVSGTGKLAPAGSFGNPMQPQANMLFFEYVVANKKEKLLPMFSLGPTQMNLKYWKTRCGFPGTWELIWDLYTGGMHWQADEKVTVQDRVAYLLLAHLNYLVPAARSKVGCLKVPFPTASIQSQISWFTSHAGNAITATKYVTEKVGARRAYNTVWTEVNQLANEMFPDWASKPIVEPEIPEFQPNA